MQVVHKEQDSTKISLVMLLITESVVTSGIKLLDYVGDGRAGVTLMNMNQTQT